MFGTDAAFEFEQTFFNKMDALFRVGAANLHGVTSRGLALGVAVELGQQVGFDAAHEFG